MTSNTINLLQTFISLCLSMNYDYKQKVKTKSVLLSNTFVLQKNIRIKNNTIKNFGTR